MTPSAVPSLGGREGNDVVAHHAPSSRSCKGRPRAVVAIRGQGDRAHELAREGYPKRLWSGPGQGRALGPWWTPEEAGTQGIVGSFPLSSGRQTRPLTPHPSDQVLTWG